MITWTNFIDRTPPEDGHILLARKIEPHFPAFEDFDVFASYWRSGNGCVTNEHGDYVKPNGNYFWSIINRPLLSEVKP